MTSSRFVPPCHSPSMNITRSTLCRTNGRNMLLTLPVVTNSAWILGATRVRYSTQWLQVGDEYSMRVTGAEMLPMGVSGRPAGARSFGTLTVQQTLEIRVGKCSSESCCKYLPSSHKALSCPWDSSPRRIEVSLHYRAQNPLCSCQT